MTEKEINEQKRNRKPPEGFTRLLVMVPLSLVRRLDLYAKFMRFENPGVNVSRSDALRALLLSGIEADADFKAWAGKAAVAEDVDAGASS